MKWKIELQNNFSTGHRQRTNECGFQDGNELVRRKLFSKSYLLVILLSLNKYRITLVFPFLSFGFMGLHLNNYRILVEVSILLFIFPKNRSWIMILPFGGVNVRWKDKKRIPKFGFSFSLLLNHIFPDSAGKSLRPLTINLILGFLHTGFAN